MMIDRSSRTHEMGRTRSSGTMLEPPTSTTTGWAPSCRCNAGEPIPATVADFFCGSGTTGAVATKHGRRFIGVDLSAEYLQRLAPDRLELQPFLTNADMGAA